MSERIAEERHAPPDEEAAHRAGDECDADPGEQCTLQELIHGGGPRCNAHGRRLRRADRARGRDGVGRAPHRQLGAGLARPPPRGLALRRHVRESRDREGLRDARADRVTMRADFRRFANERKIKMFDHTTTRFHALNGMPKKQS